MKRKPFQKRRDVRGRAVKQRVSDLWCPRKWYWIAVYICLEVNGQNSFLGHIKRRIVPLTEVEAG